MEPRRGRLSMFGSGSENRHRVAKVTGGAASKLSKMCAAAPLGPAPFFLAVPQSAGNYPDTAILLGTLPPQRVGMPGASFVDTPSGTDSLDHACGGRSSVG